MARRAIPYEEARKGAEAFFRGDSLRTEVFLSRYALRALDGHWLETTPDRMWDRVARTMTRPEKDRAFWLREFRKLLEDFKFVPAGRILFGAQNPRAATLFNCYFIPVREDSVDGITRWINEASRTFSLGGGVGTNIDVLRPRGALVRAAGVESSGSASFMEVFSTVNLPPETPLSAVDHLYRKAWESGCKGITVFREGTRASVLEVSGRDGVYRAEAGAPQGVCTFCEVPVPKGAA